MKVLVVVRWPVGGIRTYLDYVYKTILTKGYECKFVIVDETETNFITTNLKSYGAECSVLKSNQSNFYYAKQVYKQLKKDSYDVLHCHGFTSCIISLFPARIKGVPVILTSHDVLLKSQFVGQKGYLKRLALSLIFNRCSVIQSVSQDAKDNLHEMLPLLQKNNSIVIDNGIDSEKFRNCNVINLHEQLGVSKDTMVIGFFGRFMGQKGFTYIINAVELLHKDPDFKKPFVVITVGQGGFFREEKAEIKKLGLETSFIHLPYISNIAETIKSTDLVLMPSLWEACGLLAMESMVAGTAIITSECIGLREVTKNTPAITVPIKSSLAIANAIKNINEEKNEEFRCFADEASKRFSIENTIDQVDKMYQRFQNN